LKNTEPVAPSETDMPDCRSHKSSGLSRAELFGGLYILACANGLVSQVRDSIEQIGWVTATNETFGISAIIFVACIAGVALTLGGAIRRANPIDYVISAVTLLLFALPIGQLAWLAVTILSIYIIFFTAPDDLTRRGSTIMLAATVPLLWSKLLLHFFGDFILAVDTELASWICNTPHDGNIVEFVDGSPGGMVILPSCSSLANMSLAFLCLVTVYKIVGHKWRPMDFVWSLAVSTSALAVNVTRIGLMGMNRPQFELWHGPTGASVTAGLILLLAIGISVLGARREILARL
jgi:hypothetical protein